MSKFSTLLGTYTARSNSSNSRLAARCGVERSLFQKYLSGQRVMPGTFPIQLLMEELMLSPDEKEELFAEFQRQYMGEELYCQRMQIHAMISEFGKYIAVPRNAGRRTAKQKTEEVPEFLAMKDARVVEETVRELLAYEAAHTQGEFLLVLQPEQQELMRLIWQVCSREKVPLRHIVCVEKSDAGEKRSAGGSYNLSLLRAFLPYLTMEASSQVYFYYDDVRSHLNSMSLMPGLLVTPNYVFRFDWKGVRGTVSQSPAVNHFYREEYRRLEEKCVPFVKHLASLDELVVFYAENGLCTVSMQEDPCMSYSFSRELLTTVLKPEIPHRDSLIQGILELLAGWKQKAEQEGHPVDLNFFTEQRMKRFLEEGKLGEYAEELYTPVPVEYRRKMLLRFCEDAKSGVLDAHLMRGSGMPLDGSLIVQKCGDTGICLIYRSPGGNRPVLALRETSLVRAFSDYFTWICTENWVKNREETLQYLEKVVAEYFPEDAE